MPPEERGPAAATATTTAPGADYEVLRPSSGDLSPDADRALKRGLAGALPDLRMDELFDVRPDIFRELDDLVVVRDGGRPGAALGSRWETTADGEDFLHITVQFVGRSLRRGPVFVQSWTALLAAVTAGRHFPWLSALRTYNPVAYCAMERFGAQAGGEIYPAIRDAGAGEPGVAATAPAIAARLCPGAPFEAGTGRLPGVGRPRRLYRERPASRDDDVDTYFRAVLTDPGDRLLCVVRLSARDADRAVTARFAERATRRPQENP